MILSEVYKKFPEQKNCIEFLEKIRWKETPICPYCNSTRSHFYPDELRHFCHICKTSYKVTVKTIFDDTRLPLQKWFFAIYLILSEKKNISIRQLADNLEVNKNTAWSIQKKINQAKEESPSLLLAIHNILSTKTIGV